MADKALAVVSRGEWDLMLEQAAMLVPTGFLPESIRSAAQAAAIILKGRELGVPAMYALSNIAVIKGKPVAGAEVLQALIYRDHGDTALIPAESTSAKATYRFKRRGWPEYQTFSFTIEDARQAGITNNPTWAKYPAAMLRARCISAIARMAFADSIGGMYTPEELGAAVEVDAEGQFTITSSPAEPDPEPAPQAAPAEATFREVPATPEPARGNAPGHLVTKARAEEVKALAAQAGLAGDALRAIWADKLEIPAPGWSKLTNDQADALAREFQKVIADKEQPAPEPETAPAPTDEFEGLDF